MEAVARAGGVREIIDIGALPSTIAAKKPAAWRRVLGVLAFREKTIFIDRTQASVRVRFTEGHEASHGFIPWHAHTYHLDNEGRLHPDTKEKAEIEANLGSSHLLFQGPDEFFKNVLEMQAGIEAPVAIASMYEASIHASIRYYVEHNPYRVAVLMCGLYVGRDGAVPIWGSCESRSYRERHGRLTARFPSGRLAIEPASTPSPIGELAWAGRQGTVPTADLRLPDVTGAEHDFVGESFNNGRTRFVMVTERRARLLGRRVRVIDLSQSEAG